MAELKVGIVGAPRGSSFIAAIGAVTETELVAVCDINEANLNRTADHHGVPNRFTEYEAMLESGIDMVVVSTPMSLHVPQSVAALERGIHVLSEVTAATTLEQCVQLRDAAVNSSAKYMLSENYCYMRPNVLVKSLVEHGLFGEIYFAEGEYVHDVKFLHHTADGKPTWRYYDQVGKNGCTYGTHSLGPVLQWFKEPVVTVSCVGSGIHTDPEHLIDDTVLMNCKTASGALIKIRLDMMSNRPHNMAYYSLQGTKGCYEASRGFGDQPKIWLADHSEKVEWRSLYDFADEFMPDIWKNPPDEAKRAGHGGGDYFVIREFVDAVLNDMKPPIDIWDALNFTVPGLVSEESIAQNGAPLPVPNF
ncbi:MAG: Gfo/Idh/MocA family oxidoreductase [Candidatus Poribacteria bacterium]|nr:Gfo/Idh/MocA family oxidoreductase [Candidatus Poribacteria bacterium]